MQKGLHKARKNAPEESLFEYKKFLSWLLHKTTDCKAGGPWFLVSEENHGNILPSAKDAKTALESAIKTPKQVD